MDDSVHEAQRKAIEALKYIGQNYWKQLTNFTNEEQTENDSPILKGQLIFTVEQLRNRLSYFDNFDQIQYASFERDIRFLQLTTYKDSALYLLKYKQCLTKALTLVTTYISRTFENSTKAVLEKAKSVIDKYAESFPIYYCLFVANASQLQPLLKELEPKWSKSDQYADMLEQCYKEYFYQRGVLMEPSFRLTVENLVNENAKSCCSLHLETLTELCVTLRTKILDERCYTNDGTDVVYKGLAKVFEELLGDLTERLLYRSQMFAANEIGNYNPAEGDLAYPEKLTMIKVPVQTSEQVVDSRRHLDFTVKTVCQNFIVDSADAFVSEVKKYLSQVKGILNQNPNVNLGRDCNFAKPKIVSQLIANTYRTLKINWPKFRDQLALYLCNAENENILATPVKRKIIAVLEEFVEVIKKRYSEEDAQLLRLPSSQEWHLLMS
ncbi:Conserved oligomeric Golgi complex subunit 3 [Trichinella britovi]|uniref:Conserved oligomeric Golgi complex subunit 3 n=1 Tax=Trichinella britovi TaxID=45882 RepID=A0A0V1D273_TRIBR|nr:Conserved oligomeric Golgi complex subunit 3 [Trichinella britovi]